MRIGRCRVKVDRLVKQVAGLGGIRPSECVEVRQRSIEAGKGALRVIPAVEILRMLPQRAMELSATELRLDALDDASRDLILHGKHVAEIAIVPVRPNLRPRACVDKLNADADLGASPAHAALQEITCPELSCRRRAVAVLRFTEPRRIAGDDGKSSPA